MKTILLVEDEKVIRDFIAFNLKSAGYSVIEAESGEDAIEIFDSSDEIDVILLDIMLPRKNGFEVCEYIRSKNQQVGIIFLTAKALEADKLTGLKGGADDYITKPFSTAELIARVDSIYRRVSISSVTNDTAASDFLTCGEFKLDMIRHSLIFADKNIELTQIEFQMLECFFRNKGQLLSRKYLLDKVWGEPYYGDDKVVDVNIRRLRVKIEAEPSNPVHLITVWGKGYILK